MKQPLPRIAALTAGGAVLAALAFAGARSSEVPPPPTEPENDRAALRAFYTAPPVIPHEVTSRGNKECLHCHQDIRKIGDRETVISPHLELQNCQQCHVGTQMFNRAFEPELPATTWVGLEAPGLGTRANSYAPPTVPHRLFMRENCVSCHTPERSQTELHTTHKERSQCLQCHALDAGQQF